MFYSVGRLYREIHKMQRDNYQKVINQKQTR